MRKWSKIIAPVAVLVILAVAYFALRGSLGGTAVETPAPSANPDSVTLITLLSENLEKIVVERGGEVYTFTASQAEVMTQSVQPDGSVANVPQMQQVWASKDFPVDSSAVRSFAYAIDNLTSQRLIEENPADLAKYGLDKPVVLNFFAKDGKQESLRIGSATPTKESYYVQKGGSNTVYTLESYFGGRLLATKLDLMSKTFYDRTDLTVDDMTVLNVSKNGEKFFDSHLVTAPATWALTYPFEIAADYPDLNKFFEGLVGMAATQIVAENPQDMKLYGLDKPKYVFEYTLGGKSYTLKVGQSSEILYGKFDGDGRVFTLDPTLVNAAEMPLIDVVELLVYVPSIFDAESLVVEIDGRVDELRMNATKESEDVDEYFFNGKKVEGDNNQTMFRRYYQALIAMMGDKLDLEAKPQGTAAIRLTYTMEAGVAGDKTTVIELIPTPDEYGFYMMKNGKYTGLIMGKRQLDQENMGVRNAYNNLINALKATP